MVRFIARHRYFFMALIFIVIVFGIIFLAKKTNDIKVGRSVMDDRQEGKSVAPQDDAPANVLVSTNETKKSFDSKDGWFIGRSQNEVSSPSDANTYDEFNGTHARFKMRAGDSIALHVSG